MSEAEVIDPKLTKQGEALVSYNKMAVFIVLLDFILVYWQDLSAKVIP